MKMRERNGRDKWTKNPKEKGAGGIGGRSGRIALRRERDISSSEMRRKEINVAKQVGWAARMVVSE